MEFLAHLEPKSHDSFQKGIFKLTYHKQMLNIFTSNNKSETKVQWLYKKLTFSI